MIFLRIPVEVFSMTLETLKWLSEILEGPPSLLDVVKYYRLVEKKGGILERIPP